METHKVISKSSIVLVVCLVAVIILIKFVNPIDYSDADKSKIPYQYLHQLYLS